MHLILRRRRTRVQVARDYHCRCTKTPTSLRRGVSVVLRLEHRLWSHGLSGCCRVWPLRRRGLERSSDHVLESRYLRNLGRGQARTMRFFFNAISTTEQYFEPEVEFNDCECTYDRETGERNIGVERAGRKRRGPASQVWAHCGHTDNLGLMRPRDKCHWG